jgi:siroheme synthase-like protein
MSRAIPFPPYDLPIFVNTGGAFDARCLVVAVIGGGTVGKRKARTLLQAGAAVRMIALEPQPDDMADERLDWRAEPYRPAHLDGADLVVTAAPHDVSERVYQDARGLGLWVSRADDARRGDFLIPATLRRGDRFQVAVSTRGASPALARRVRDRIADVFDDTFGEWVELLGFWRDWTSLWVAPPARTQAFLEEISEWHWLERYRAEGAGAVSRAYLELAARMIAPTSIIM